MDAKTYIETKNKITHNCDALKCIMPEGCPFGRDLNGRDLGCHSFEAQYPEEAIAICQRFISRMELKKQTTPESDDSELI